MPKRTTNSGPPNKKKSSGPYAAEQRKLTSRVEMNRRYKQSYKEAEELRLGKRPGGLYYKGPKVNKKTKGKKK